MLSWAENEMIRAVGINRRYRVVGYDRGGGGVVEGAGPGGYTLPRRGGRVVECGGLENRYVGNPGVGGSNPPLSAFWLVSTALRALSARFGLIRPRFSAFQLFVVRLMSGYASRRPPGRSPAGTFDKTFAEGRVVTNRVLPADKLKC